MKAELQVVEAGLTQCQVQAEIRSNPLDLMRRLKNLGDLVLLPTGEDRRLFAAFDPAVVRMVLARGMRTHRDLLRQMVGEGLFVVESGDKWRTRRRLLQRLFADNWLVTSQHVLISTVERYLDLLTVDERTATVDLTRIMQEISIWMILRLVDPALDDEAATGLTTALYDVVRYLDLRLFSPERLSPLHEGAYRAGREAISRFVDRRSGSDGSGKGCPADTGSPAGRGLLVGLLNETEARVRAGDDLGAASAELVEEELISLLIAGVETVGALLTWALWYLDRNPLVGRRCVDEAMAGVAAHPTIRAAVLETLRLAPPAWALRRVIPARAECAGFEFRQGDTVLLCPYVTHRDPALWDDPEDFVPDRFLRGMPPAGSYFPFAGGPHRCLGHELALLEAEVAISAVLRRFEIEVCAPAGGHQVRPGIALSLEPDPRAVLTARGGGL